jgi:hypothetical protein
MEKVILKVAHVVVDQRLGEPVTVAESVKHRSLADAGRGRDGLHRQRVRPLFGQQRARRAQDALAIGGCVTAFAALAHHRKLAWLPEIAAGYRIYLDHESTYAIFLSNWTDGPER